ncbi:MAG: hypothetical protein A2286_14435 [Gammaproteobacteria bacterium RIFOXYA12_FULL_61_12]|nr:MAG: hypothetical protein A2286_14435 [Gammaproteobacteria bacterium RIFOXYA12_FULL_61_12]OGT89655.1 MAG: hypothetical protein A2514_14770 [Gammaproteobacteria bacterium RIFOXYD12_FULL_61_37]
MPSNAASSQNHKHRIQPFWNRVPDFFLYVLSPTPLILCVVFGALTALLPFWPVYLLLFALMTKYAFEALIRTSEGDLDPPGLAADVFNENFGLVFKQLAIYLITGAIILSLVLKGMLVPAKAMGIAFLFLLPAMTMVLASTSSLLSAINPIMLIGMVTRVGWSYLGLYGLLLVVYMAESNAQGFLLSRVGPQAIFPLYNAVNFLFSVLAYHMMGYLLYQHHEALGISQRIFESESHDPTGGKLEQFHAFMEKGMTEAAKAELIGRVRDEPVNAELRRKLSAFLMVHGTEDDKVKFARYIIPILVENGQANEAGRLYTDLAAGSAGFALGRADHYLALIRALNTMGQGKAAFALAKNIHKRFPKETEVADIYIEMAQLVSHKFSRDDLALQMLGFVLKNYPRHPRCGEAEQLAQTIKRLAST